MSEESAPLPRPLPPRSIGDHIAGALTWFGPVRIASTMAAVAVVVGGGYWLVRSPPPPTEVGLPVASSGVTTVPDATLPPPVTRAASDPPPSSAPARVVVHVAGAVASPGVVQLEPGGRVHAAIDAAGGPTPDADLDGLNLAAEVVDGARIYVPEVGEVDPASVPSGGVAPVDAVAADDSSPPGPIDVNRATAAQLEILPGVGPATAAAIVDDRERNGPFASVDDLDRVPGIGPAKLAAIRELVTV